MNGFRPSILLGSASCAAMLSVAACPAYAQTAPAPAGAASQVEEVIVTAQKRSENLQSVPISVQVVGHEALATQNLNSLGDLAVTLPAVEIGSEGRSSNLYIRGIGSGLNQTFDQSVGTFIDDVYHGRSRTTAGTFIDVDSVEVLKGPQSTFFGNNAIAGAVSITTRKPTMSQEGSVRALYGQYGQYALEGMANLPFGDRLSVRLAGILDGQDGWMDNVVTGGHAPEERNAAGRVSIRFEPTPDLDLILKGELGRNENRSGLYNGIGDCPPAAPFTAAGFCAALLAQGLPTYEGNKESQAPGQGMLLTTGDLALTMNYRRGGLTFTSVTGFYAYHFNLNLNASGLPQDAINIQAPERYHQFSQEFRVASPAGQALEWLAGAYYQTDHLTFNQATDFAFLTPVIASIPPFAPLVPYLPLGQNIEFSQPEDIYSAFGSLTWNVTDRLKLSGGLRGSIVHKSFAWDLYYGQATQQYGGIVPLPAALQPFGAALGLGAPGALSGARTDRALMPSARAQYQFSPEVMAYVSYARGFKAGGFNGVDVTANPDNIPYAPEHVNAYEAGLKSKWLDNRLLLNLAVFRSDYSDLQVAINAFSSSGAVLGLVRNAASSVSQGVEVEGELVASEHLRFSANATYLDAKYDSYPNAGPTVLQSFQGQAFQDLSGRPTPFAPRWSGTLRGVYQTELPGGFHLTAEIDPYFSSSYFLVGTDDPLLRQDGFMRLDGRLTLDSPDRRWSFDIIGKNLTNKRLFDLREALPVSPGATLLLIQAPINVSGQIRFRW